MTRQRKAAANRSNAARSTGPRTKAGKVAAKMNAVAHGLRAAAVVLPGEQAEEWEAHRVGVRAALAPVGTLETELSDRVALVTWRLRRVVGYETAATVAEQDAAAADAARGGPDGSDAFAGALALPRPGRTPAGVREELGAVRARVADAAVGRDLLRRLQVAPAESPLDGREADRLCREAFAHMPANLAGGDEDYEDDDDFEEAVAFDDDRTRRFLAAAGVPEGWQGAPDLWDGWTAGAVVAGLAAIAADAGLGAVALIERAVREAGRAAEADGRRAETLAAELAKLEAEAAKAAVAARAAVVLPSAAVLDKVARYEAHLGRQLTQAMHLLERLQATRAGAPPAPAAALDVTVDVGLPGLGPAS